MFGRTEKTVTQTVSVALNSLTGPSWKWWLQMEFKCLCEISLSEKFSFFHIHLEKQL
jgi:hypothetical protein